MTRNFKALGLVLVAVLALSAVAAQAASAQGKLTSDGPVTLVGQVTGPVAENSFTMFGGSTVCPTLNIGGHEVAATPHKLVPNGATQVTITPHFGPCTSLGFPSTIDMNGCDLVFDLKETTVLHTYRVTVTYECDVGKKPVVTIFSSAAKHTANEPFCQLEITPKTDPGIQNVTARDTTNGNIDITGTIEGLEAHKKSPTGSILCPSETTTAGVIHMDMRVEGRDGGGEATGISLSE